MRRYPLTSPRYLKSGEERPEIAAGPEAISRSGLLARVALGLGAVSAGGAAAQDLTAATGASALSARDQEVFKVALAIEELQAAFYAQALSAGKLTGEAREFAQVVGAEEREHLRYLRQAVGSGANRARRYSFGAALTDQKKFLATAVELEDTGLAAYNGQATNLSRGALARIARVISVEARHASWVRVLAGEQPAPVAVDVPISAAQSQAALRRFVA